MSWMANCRTQSFLLFLGMKSWEKLSNAAPTFEHLAKGRGSGSLGSVGLAAIVSIAKRTGKTSVTTHGSPAIRSMAAMLNLRWPKRPFVFH